jgi:uncharacterized membrane protein YedE/YeeE
MAMNMPFYAHDSFGYPTAMALATVIGIAFGFVLERAGFGRATTLAAQFYGGDNRVLKVMFSAIVTAAVGLGLLSGVGWLDMSLVQIPETFLWPLVVGGLILGVGFVVSGYCPGTAVVAAGSGRIDGLVALVGVMIGSVLFGFGYPWLEGFYTSGAMGVVTLPALLHLPWAVVALAVVVMAVAAFFGAEALEQWLARRRNEPAPEGSARLRNRVMLGFGLAGAAGLGTLLLAPPAQTARATVRPESAVTAVSTASTPGTQSLASKVDTVTALALAQRLLADTDPVYLVDLRAREVCAAKPIPGALCLPADDPSGAFMATLAPTRTLVLYAQGDVAEVPPAAERYAGPLALLEGGYDAFDAAVLAEPVAPKTATSAEASDYRLRVALHARFTGSQATQPAVDVKPRAVKRAVKKGGGC